ncbi:YhgE/Pip domain-containing protein [Corynebacterium sp. HS2168-gen11]|uniref:YhgE/Pip domain-containing protein n=1 Tax=Corynebacterium sp. HS2168-gen11 TaxID=2974027 RepID=UPI00216AB5CF|nr:YhgE/Pip domain-containing protein [Corynebacterium sp. HS2168-gen11]MCS4535180.1 YhgE/Pip domain-containing protein [Corynebacterium sp. HS2168-gen11]
MSIAYIGTELRRFGHGKLPPIALLVIVLMPLLFGGLFVWSYWDPIGRIDRLPVALVNSDQGATVNNEQVHAGDQIVEKLVQTKALDFRTVTAQQAQEGVRDGTYYFAIELPTDFSQAVVSAASQDPHQAQIQAVYNNTNGLIATTLGNQAVARVVEVMNERFGTEIVNKLVIGFSTIDEGLGKAATGAQQLHDGTNAAGTGATKLADGATTLEDGLARAHDGASALHDGATQLATGLAQADDGSQRLSEGLVKLQQGTDRLGNGAAEVAKGVHTIVGSAQTLTTAQQQALQPLYDLTEQLRQTHIPQAITLAEQAEAFLTQIETGSPFSDQGLVGKLQQLDAGAQEIQRQLSDPQAQYRQGLNTAVEAAAKLSHGVHKLADGSTRLVVGTEKLVDGTSKLTNGSTKLTVGAQQLAEGVVRLDAGSGELALKLTEAGERLPQFGDQAAHTIAAPVTVTEPKDHMGLFGQGLAPMFISLGLFMGATAMFMLLKPYQRRANDSGMAPLRVILANYFPAVLIGIAQATLMFLVQRFAIGMTAVHEFKLWLAMIFISAVFITITQGLNTVFGTAVGRVLSIGLMTLQMVSSGGLYPPETQPLPIRAFHHIDPMTFSVNLLREMIFNPDYGSDPRTGAAIVNLLLIAVLFFTISSVAVWRNRVWRKKDLRPEISV